MNKITKYINLIMICLAALLLSGCANFTGGGVQTSGIGGGSSSSQGGVEITFSENNPRSEYFKGEPITFAFLFSNYQMHEVEDMQLKITGFDRGNVNGVPETDSVSSISKFSEVAGPGLKTDYIYEEVEVDNFEKEFPFNPKIRYCYTQQSFKKEEICVPATNNICSDDIVVQSNVEENGAFNFEILRVNAISGKIRIDFEMTNAISGKIVDECFEREGFASSFDGVVAKLGVEDGECFPIGTENFLFTNGKANFYCEFARTGDDSYPSQVYVSASSLYEQETSLSITVRDPAYGVG